MQLQVEQSGVPLHSAGVSPSCRPRAGR
jgi:hypothetical protein